MILLQINLLDFFFSPYLSILYIIVIVVGIFFIDKRHEEEIQQQINLTEEPLIEQIEIMSKQWRSHAHDFHNHVEVLLALLEEEKYREAKEYMENIHTSIGEVQNKIFPFQQPVVNALLQAKAIYAEKLGIQLEVQSECPAVFPQLQTYDMIRLLGNLLDNAIEELESMENMEEKLINVRYVNKLNIHILTIENNGRELSEEQRRLIFTNGYSTKKNHQGSGLATIYEIVQQNLGEINVTNQNGKVIFQIAIPG